MASATNFGLDSLQASVGSDLEGDKAAHILGKLASREAERRAQLDEQAEKSRYSQCTAPSVFPASLNCISRAGVTAWLQPHCRASAAPNESCKAFLLRVDAWQQHSQAVLDSICKYVAHIAPPSKNCTVKCE